MINYQIRSCSLTDIADHIRRDDRGGALARARAAYREEKINAFDLAEIFFAVGNTNDNDAVNRVRRLGGSSMRRGHVPAASPDASSKQNALLPFSRNEHDESVPSPTRRLYQKAILSVNYAG